MVQAPPGHELAKHKGQTRLVEIEDGMGAKRVLAMAKAAAAKEFDADARCWAVLGLIRQGVFFGVEPEAIFEQAYGDPSGRQFWSDWFSTRMSSKTFAKLLSSPRGERTDPDTKTGLGPFPVFPEDRLRAALSDAPDELTADAHGDVAGEPLARWLVRSRHRELVHATLAAYLNAAPAPAVATAKHPATHDEIREAGIAFYAAAPDPKPNGTAAISPVKAMLAHQGRYAKYDDVRAALATDEFKRLRRRVGRPVKQVG